MFNLVDLTGKKIVLTGASQGIGRDTAIMLSKLGAKMRRNYRKLYQCWKERVINIICWISMS